MEGIQKPFIVAYCGVSTKITPIVTGGDMRYLISLPTRGLIIEKVIDEEGIESWQEGQERGRTIVAEEIGAIIEKMDM